MPIGRARLLTGVWFLVATLCMVWPGATLFARIEPSMLGLPFSMASIVVWIVGSIVVLYLLDRVERRQAEDSE